MALVYWPPRLLTAVTLGLHRTVLLPRSCRLGKKPQRRRRHTQGRLWADGAAERTCAWCEQAHSQEIETEHGAGLVLSICPKFNNPHW